MKALTIVIGQPYYDEKFSIDVYTCDIEEIAAGADPVDSADIRQGDIGYALDYAYRIAREVIQANMVSATNTNN